MKNIITILLTISFSYCQKMKVSEGDIKNLIGINQYDVVFNYSNLQIPNYDSEAEFLKDKMAKREEKGTSQAFKKSWYNDREERYHPKFIESFNKRFKNNEVNIAENTNATYIMSIHTTKLYAGYNVGVLRQNAEIDAVITIYSKKNPNKILLKGKYKDIQGSGAMGYDYNSGYRISECYAKLAKNFAYYIKKKAK